ncbi:hypothetical protein [Nocardioides deserti]|uniref:WD40 repeat domain-containing protein n=1 Tax=Nocardioides deserti TaxID=1588644 RepID=A0ABR6U5V5_9ACTN|nr:hypothetical protein [Nocardioides deserti]MBC2959538.1 hypothetical protein [Nocardioides deserti]GGO73828.1 hypothetical protein GCM10012276_20380 [Nocardioides deserti]
MPNPPSRPAAAAGAAVLVLLLGACGDDSASGIGGGDAGTTWSAAADPLDTSGLVWAADGTVHLPDGSTIETEQDIAAYVVAGPGAYVVPADDDGSTGRLLLATPDGTVEETGAQVDPATLRTSPDGRYLAFVDPATGEQDEYGTPVGTVVVVDTVEGEEVVRSAEGMGDPGSDDLADLYEDAEEPAVLGLTDTTAYVVGPDAVLAYDLATGDATTAAGSASEAYDADWFAELRPEAALTNPAGTWTIVDPPTGDPVRLVPEGGGDPVATRVPGGGVYELDSWLDDETAVGGALDGQTDVLIGCSLPSGDCEPLPGVPPGALLPVDRSGPAGPTVRR